MLKTLFSELEVRKRLKFVSDSVFDLTIIIISKTNMLWRSQDLSVDDRFAQIQYPADTDQVQLPTADLNVYFYDVEWFWICIMRFTFTTIYFSIRSHPPYNFSLSKFSLYLSNFNSIFRYIYKLFFFSFFFFYFLFSQNIDKKLLL